MTVGQNPAEALIDPELRALAAQMPPANITRETLPAIRTAVVAMMTGGAPVALDGVHAEERTVERPDGPPLRLLHYRPMQASRSPAPAVLHMHGGGFILGVPEMDHATNLALARDLRCHVVSVDYRLAPEHPYPAALDDCTAALDWLVGAAETFGVDPMRIGIKGESAGGGLAAALAVRERDRGNDRIAFQHLTYPMLDDRTGTTGAVPGFVGTVGWSAANNRFAWDCLLGRPPGATDTSPQASPARAEHLAGLPPTYLSVGTLDLFFTEILAFAARLRDAGVPVELHVHAGAFHGFENAPAARVAWEAVASSRRSLERALHS